jgi:hypothetical protein
MEWCGKYKTFVRGQAPFTQLLAHRVLPSASDLADMGTEGVTYPPCSKPSESHSGLDVSMRLWVDYSLLARRLRLVRVFLISAAIGRLGAGLWPMVCLPAQIPR